ncbi:MAG: hypothetical protein FWF87_01960 [Synergistaceae bacterium]|nr:hypothetical protein [Synergistaceae bacterium]
MLKFKKVSIMALFVLLVFSASAFAHVTLILKAPSNLPLNSSGLSIRVYEGTGTDTLTELLPESTSALEYVYKFPWPGTFNYRVTSSPASLYYGATKLFYFTEDDVISELVVSQDLESGPRPSGPETWGAASVNIFTDQIIENLFNTSTLTGFPAGGLQTPTFTTPKGHWQVTTQQDLMDFVGNVAATYGKAHLFSLGKSPLLNYDIPIIIVTNETIPAGSSFEEAAEIIRDGGKPTFFHQGQIHGDEASGCEGALQMLLDVVGPYGAKYLEKVNYVCVPRFNVEGGARWTRSSTTPVIDMNRDHLRMRAPEVRMVHKGYLELMPEVTMDGHEIGYYTVTSTTTRTTAAYATGGVTDLESTPSTSMINPSMALNDYALDVYGVNMHNGLAAAGIRSNHYENANNGWTANHGIGRAYYGLMGSVSFLVEVRGLSSLLMARRAYAHVLAAKILFETLYDKADETKALVVAGRKAVKDLGEIYDPNVKIPLYQYASGAGTAYMNTGAKTPGSRYSIYETKRHQADMLGNLVKVSSTDANMVNKAHAINDATHFERSRPTAYVIPKGITETAVNSGDYAINYDYLLDSLKANRVEYYEVKLGQKAPLRQYFYVSGNGTTGITPNATPNTNVLRADLRAEEEVTLTEGAYVIPLDQVAGAVAVAIFEPDISNSNGYNASVAQSLSGTEGLAVVFHSQANNNYPYYRLEKSFPRKVLPPDEPGCPIVIPPCIDLPPCVEDKIEEVLDCLGCNAGFGLLALIFAIPFVWRKK